MEKAHTDNAIYEEVDVVAEERFEITEKKLWRFQLKSGHQHQKNNPTRKFISYYLSDTLLLLLICLLYTSPSPRDS